MAKEQTQQTPEKFAMIAKISISTMGCTPVGTPEPTRLAMIFGRATGIKVGEDKVRSRTFSTLTGSFEGVNLATGQRFRSGKLYLPGGIHEAVEAAVQTEESGVFNAVKFGLEIRSIKANNPIGYSYQAVPLWEPTAIDELDEMRMEALGEAKPTVLLEAPAETTVADSVAELAKPTPAPAKRK